MKPVYAIIAGAALIMVGVARLLADKDSSIMDQVINVTFFIGLCVGVAILMFCLNKVTRR